MRFGFISDTEITYNRRVLRGISQYVKVSGCVQLRVIQANRDSKVFGGIDDAGYDGVLLGTYATKSDEAHALRTPAVNISNTHVGLRFPQIVPDDLEVGRIIAKHLLARGYRDFAFLGDRTGWAEQRWVGFSSAIVSALGDGHTPSRCIMPSMQLKAWLRKLPRPLGLMASNDPTAFDAMEACHELKLRIPEDVAVVGVDDDELYSELTNPPLSSVSQQYERIGYLAADCLMRLVRGEKIPQLTTVLPGPLMARQSSNSVAVSDQTVVQAIQFMQENLGRRVDVSEVAETMGVSLRSLEVRFKAALGQSPHKELSRLKIERAQSLLATTSLSLKQVATMSGFGTPIRLSDVFHQSTGLTPAGYRRQFMQNEEGLKDDDQR